MKIGILLLLLSSCSSFSRKSPSIIDEIEQENISVDAVLNLARSSYLKGCVDSKNYFIPEKDKSAFVDCMNMAKLHEKDIKEIITQKIPRKKREK